MPSCCCLVIYVLTTDLILNAHNCLNHLPTYLDLLDNHSLFWSPSLSSHLLHPICLGFIVLKPKIFHCDHYFECFVYVPFLLDSLFSWVPWCLLSVFHQNKNKSSTSWRKMHVRNFFFWDHDYLKITRWPSSLINSLVWNSVFYNFFPFIFISWRLITCIL